MTTKELIDKSRADMKRAVEFCKNQIGKVRSGRATASLLDGITFEYYGAPTPLAQGASISVPDARTIIVQPF
ncbi:MAG TPA: ribosome recycling factor, partial [Candidatus Kapabacteria bacterium]|nr:ribosome recycling factor [Candidatus Kapabacteria bacterium]